MQERNSPLILSLHVRRTRCCGSRVGQGVVAKSQFTTETLLSDVLSNNRKLLGVKGSAIMIVDFTSYRYFSQPPIQISAFESVEKTQAQAQNQRIAVRFVALIPPHRLSSLRRTLVSQSRHVSHQRVNSRIQIAWSSLFWLPQRIALTGRIAFANSLNGRDTDDVCL